MPLRLDSRPVGDVMVVRCDGRIVAGAEVHALQLYLRRLLLQHHDVVLQLERVDFVDSSGLGALVRLVTTARTNAGEIRLCALQPPVRRILELTKLLGLFEVYDSEAEAIIAAYLGSRYSKDDSGESNCAFSASTIRSTCALCWARCCAAPAIRPSPPPICTTPRFC